MSTRERTHVLPFIAATLVLGAFATALALAVFDLLAATRAFVAGESHWSRAMQDSIFQLDRYAETGDRSLLAAARALLEIPLADRRARIALMEGGRSLERAAVALIAGRNHPEDVPRMVRMFRLFRELPHLAEAVELWHKADVWILRLEQLADELERLEADRANNLEQISSIRSELDLLNRSINNQAVRFADAISEGARELNRLAMLIAPVAIALLSILMILVFLWAMRGIQRSRKRFWTTFERAPVGMALVDAQGRILESNDTLCAFLERPCQSLIGEPLTRFIDVRDRSALQHALECDSDSDTAANPRVEARFVRQDGTVVWGKLSISVQERTRAGCSTSIVVIEDINETRTLAAELAYQAAHDQLTGLANRREFERSLNQLLRDRLGSSRRHALCLINLDQFKLINDTFGHLAGDAVLVRLAERIQWGLRDDDLLARLDGDEFGVILRDCSIETATRIAGRIRDSIREFEFRWEERPIRISASIGVIEINQGSRDAAWLMQQVDLLCYEAKEQGRNQVRVQAEADRSSQRRQREMDWVQRIKEAIADNRMRFHGQWIAPAAGDDWRCELLLRLEDEDGRVHTAGDFMDAAERFHAARLVDQWVVRSALRLLPELLQRHPQVVSWHINLSGQSVDCDAVLPELLEALASAALPPGSVCIEITESAAVRSIEEARRFFTALKDAGCEIALDDFGKGLSTFDYLKQLPVDLVKIDGSFVRELAHSELDHAMVRSIHEIARIAGVRSVAESVESIELILRLKQIGVDLLQGHAIHNPTALAQLVLPTLENTPAELGTL